MPIARPGDALAHEFRLTEEEEKQLLPSGQHITTSDFSQMALYPNSWQLV
jgi:restriction endonuclease Mrr